MYNDELKDIRYEMKDTVFQITMKQLDETCGPITDVRKILSESLKIVATAIHAEASTIWVYSETVNEITPLVTYGGKKLNGVTLRLKEGIAGSVIDERKPVLVDNVNEDTNWSNLADEKSGFTTKTMICAPAVYKGYCCGCVQFINRIDEEFYDVKDLQFVESIVSYLLSRLEDNHEFFTFLAEENGEFAAKRREEIINNFITLIDNDKEEEIMNVVERNKAYYELNEFDKMAIKNNIKKLTKAIKKSAE